MQEKKKTSIGWFAAGFIILLLLSGSVIGLLNSKTFSGGSSGPSSDPETGLQQWIAAVNGRDVNRLYDLAPDDLKEQIPLDQFKQENLNNTLFRTGYYLSNYTLLNKQQNGTSAQIDAEVSLHQPGGLESPARDIPVLYKFALFYEHGEWKIWTLQA